MKIQFLRAASDEVVRAQAWYEEEKEGLGQEFAEELDNLVMRILRRPMDGMDEMDEMDIPSQGDHVHLVHSVHWVHAVHHSQVSTAQCAGWSVPDSGVGTYHAASTVKVSLTKM